MRAIAPSVNVQAVSGPPDIHFAFQAAGSGSMASTSLVTGSIRAMPPLQTSRSARLQLKTSQIESPT